MSDKKKEEVIRKIGEHVKKKFGGDYDAAFKHYAARRTKDGSVDSDELGDLLKDAGVGSGLTRGLYVKGIMEAVDTNKDGKISSSEFSDVME